MSKYFYGKKWTVRSGFYNYQFISIYNIPGKTTCKELWMKYGISDAEKEDITFEYKEMKITYGEA